MRSDRREFLHTGTGAAASLLLLHLSPLSADVSVSGRLQSLIEEFSASKPLQPGKITLEIPATAENGFSVPLSVRVESPMSPRDHVERVMIVAEQNPFLHVATFHFSPLSGEARVSTRIRLARTQDVLALARTNTGHVHAVRTAVRVVIGGCGV